MYDVCCKLTTSTACATTLSALKFHQNDEQNIFHKGLFWHGSHNHFECFEVPGGKEEQKALLNSNQLPAWYERSGGTLHRGSAHGCFLKRSLHHLFFHFFNNQLFFNNHANRKNGALKQFCTYGALKLQAKQKQGTKKGQTKQWIENIIERCN